MMKFVLYCTGALVYITSFAMDWSGDVLLKNIFNNSGQPIFIEIVNGRRVLTKAEFDPEKDSAQSWVNRLHSKKTDSPDSIQIRARNYSYTPTGNVKEFDIIIEKNAIREIPSGSKLQLVAAEETSLWMKQTSRTVALYKTVLIAQVTNNSKNLVTINLNHDHQNVINPQSTKMINVEVKKNHEVGIKTATHHFTYTPTGKVEKLQIIVDAKGMATIAEYIS